MSQINEAIQHVRDGKARYRVVLKLTSDRLTQRFDNDQEALSA